MGSSVPCNEYLDQILINNVNKEKAKQDIRKALAEFKALRIKYDTHVFNDGTIKKLPCISGTIPVTIKGNTYNIPVTIWLKDTHPSHPPICYVTPTSFMLIKPSKHVDANGVVYMPYLHDWKPPGSHLTCLFQIMADVFREHPPVFSKMSVATPISAPPTATTAPPRSLALFQPSKPAQSSTSTTPAPPPGPRGITPPRGGVLLPFMPTNGNTQPRQPPPPAAKPPARSASVGNTQSRQPPPTAAKRPVSVSLRQPPQSSPGQRPVSVGRLPEDRLSVRLIVPLEQLQVSPTVADSSSKPPAGTNAPSAQPGEKECSICFDAMVDAVFYKCGHSCCCMECADKMKGAKCPMCRAEILDVIKLYAS